MHFSSCFLLDWFFSIEYKRASSFIDFVVVFHVNKLVEVLKKIQVSEDDPGVVAHWNNETSTSIATSANNAALGAPAQPWWITSQPGRMTADSLQSDVFSALATVAGGRHGNGLLAPNDFSQYSNILTMLQRLELDPFLQHHAAGLPQGANHY